MLLKYAAERDIVALIRKLSSMIKLLETANQLDLLEAGVYYLVATNQSDASFDNVFHEFQQHITPPTKEYVMTIAERLIQEGRQSGVLEGIQKGEASLLIKLLNRRFPNDLTDRHLYLIHEADTETLSEWGESLINAECIEDVFKFN